jgi:cytochrome oxidase assembly protein ShyY1
MSRGETEAFWQVARRPKWIGALLIALALAAGFAALGQWQLERSFRTIGHTDSQLESVVPIDSLIKPGKSFPEPADARKVEFSATANTSNAFVVSDRVQNGTSGYWLVVDYRLETGASIPVATGWFVDLDTALNARDTVKSAMVAQVLTTHSGWLLAPEAPEAIDSSQPAVLKSLSPAQLVNLFSPEQPLQMYPGAVALSDNPWGGEAIVIGTQRQTIELNFLNIFYALEWVVFSGFAVFMWWRLVQDERLGLRRDGADPEPSQQAVKGKLDQ